MISNNQTMFQYGVNMLNYTQVNNNMNALSKTEAIKPVMKFIKLTVDKTVVK